jgi:hypothetical protein
MLAGVLLFGHRAGTRIPLPERHRPLEITRADTVRKQPGMRAQDFAHMAC